MRRRWSHRIRSVSTKKSSKSKNKSIKYIWLRSKAQTTKRLRCSLKTPRSSHGYLTGVSRVSRKRGRFSSKELIKRLNKWPLWRLNLWLNLWACTKMIMLQMSFIIKLSNMRWILIRRHSNLHLPCKIRKLQCFKVPPTMVAVKTTRVRKSKETFRIKSRTS